MTHWAHINIFPEPFIQLQQELKHHPKLQEMLATHPAGEWEIRLAQIAQYCEVIVDGEYLPEQIEKLCEILRVKLIARREDNRGLLVITSEAAAAEAVDRSAELILPAGMKIH